MAAEREWGLKADSSEPAQCASSPSVVSEGNMTILQMQDPQLYKDGVWAHTTPVLEQVSGLEQSPTPNLGCNKNPS